MLPPSGAAEESSRNQAGIGRLSGVKTPGLDAVQTRGGIRSVAQAPTRCCAPVVQNCASVVNFVPGGRDHRLTSRLRLGPIQGFFSPSCAPVAQLDRASDYGSKVGGSTPSGCTRSGGQVVHCTLGGLIPPPPATITPPRGCVIVVDDSSGCIGTGGAGLLESAHGQKAQDRVPGCSTTL